MTTLPSLCIFLNHPLVLPGCAPWNKFPYKCQSSDQHQIIAQSVWLIQDEGGGRAQYYIVLLKKKIIPVSSGRSSSLFRKKRFMLDEKFQRNTSKFAIFYIYKNPKLLFPFLFFVILAQSVWCGMMAVVRTFNSIIFLPSVLIRKN